MDKLTELLNWYASLTPDSVKEVGNFYHANAHFKDPFNDVHGVDAIKRIFDHMFVASENPRFNMHDVIVDAQTANQAFVSWTFEFGLRGTSYKIQGASHLKFDADGLVIDHRDYWDSAEELFQKLPLIGAPVRWLRRQFRTP